MHVEVIVNLVSYAQMFAKNSFGNLPNFSPTLRNINLVILANLVYLVLAKPAKYMVT